MLARFPVCAPLRKGPSKLRILSLSVLGKKKSLPLPSLDDHCGIVERHGPAYLIYAVSNLSAIFGDRTPDHQIYGETIPIEILCPHLEIMSTKLSDRDERDNFPFILALYYHIQAKEVFGRSLHNSKYNDVD
jgi:hypothetical protein